MTFFNRSFGVLLLTFGLGVGLSVAVPAAAWAQEAPYPAPYGDLRGLIDRTQSDLRAAADLEHGNDKQRNRYRNAQEHLSNLDRNLSKGRFDKGDWNHSIGDLKDILEHNTLQASSRDALQHDLEDLRIARDRTY